MKDRTRRHAVRILMLLLLAAAAERRLADFDFNTLGGLIIANDESVVGEEVRDKLIVLHDFVAPRPLSSSERVVPAPAHPAPRSIVRVVFDLESPRAPPLRSA